jgi:SET domain-containing protein
MALLEKQLFVKKSTLPDAGKGLFTKKFIPKGTRIIEYTGTIKTWKEVQAEEGENGYVYYVTRSHVIDALKIKNSLARYANDARGLQRVPGITNNAEYIEDGKRVYIEAAKDIPAKSEIFVSYGPEYWQVIRHNIRIDEKEKKNNHKVTKVGKKVKGVKTNNTRKRTKPKRASSK